MRRYRIAVIRGDGVGTEAAGNLEFEEAARRRDEIKRLQSVALAVGDDPLARQEEIEAAAGAYAGDARSAAKA